VQTSPNTDSLYSVAAVAPTHFVTHLTHTGTTPITIRVTGIPDAVYYQIASDAEKTDRLVTTHAVTDGTLTVELMADSICVLTTQAP
jgi:hypothetical protein